MFAKRILVSGALVGLMSASAQAGVMPDQGKTDRGSGNVINMRDGSDATSSESGRNQSSRPSGNERQPSSGDSGAASVDTSERGQPTTTAASEGDTGGQPETRKSGSDGAAAKPGSTACPDDLTGFGKDVPLRVGVRQVVPATYDISYGPDVDTDKSVSWSADCVAWKKVLDRVAARNGLVTEVKSDRVILRTDRQNRIGGSGFRILPFGGDKPGTDTDESSDKPAKTDITMKSDQDDEAPSQKKDDGPETWVAQPGSTLRETLRQWTKRTEWTLAYESEYEYPVQAKATFKGSFQDVVAGLVTSFNKAGAEPRIRTYMHRKNKVVRVKNASSEIIQ